MKRKTLRPTTTLTALLCEADSVFDFPAIPKYCINLARRTDRRALMDAEFQRHNLEVEFITAVDGRTLTMPELSTKQEPYAAANWACILSHRGIIERATSEYICVFEDDIKLCDGFSERAASINCNFDIFYFGSIDRDVYESTGDGYYRTISMAGTWAYMMRNTVFEFFVRNVTYNWGPDEFFSEVLLKRFKGVTTLPPMATITGNDSDIGGPTPAQ